MLRITVANIRWDCEGMTPEECRLPSTQSIDFSEGTLPDPAPTMNMNEVLALWHEPIATALHGRYGFNVLGFDFGGLMPRPLLHQGSPAASINAAESSNYLAQSQAAMLGAGAGWGSHPDHAQAASAVSAQLLQSTPLSQPSALAQQWQQSRRQALGSVTAPSPALVRQVREMQRQLADSLGPMQIRPESRPPAQEEMDHFLRNIGRASQTPQRPVETGVDRFFSNLRGHTLNDVVLFMAPMLKLRGDSPQCPVCNEGNTSKLEYHIVMHSDAHSDCSFHCATCGLVVVPERTGFSLRFGDRTISIGYQWLGTKPGPEFMRFAETLLTWRGDLRLGTKRKTRQLVVLESPQPEETE